MDRFKLDDIESDYDTVEPMRASSFDMSFTLSNSRVATAAAADDGCIDNFSDATSDTRCDSDNGHGDLDDCNEWSTTHWRAAHRTMLSDPPPSAGDASSLHVSQRRKRSSPLQTKQPIDDSPFAAAASIASTLEEKAHETLALASLCGTIPWRLTKRNQDVHLYRPSSLPADEQSKLYFRISCEVKASLPTILEYLTPSDSKSYADIEAQVFPGLLHAAVIKRMDLPEATHHPSHSHHPHATTNDTASSLDDGDDDALAEGFPRLHVKWHASRFAGRFVKPVDLFFVEYANIDTMADGRKRGFGYLRSVESFKGDELATRLHSVSANAIPPSVAKCKRAVINKGVYVVTPSSATTGASAGAYDVTFMLVLDFQQQFPSSVTTKIIQNFTDRLVGIRNLLFNTLFKPVALVTKASWKKAHNNKCNICFATFSIVKLEHHCRACGEAVCGQCSRRWVVQPGQQHKETLKRLCTHCSLQARSYLMGNELQPASPSPRRQLTAMPSPDSGLRLTTGSVATHRRPLLSPSLSPIEPRVCDVQVASAVSTDLNHFTAVSTAFEALTTSLGGVAPHFMIVAYSNAYDGHAVYEALAHVAPDTLFMGGTSSAGVLSERGSISRGPGLALWGIYDPEGSYAVLNADLDVESPRDAAQRCVAQSLEMLCMEPDDAPDVVWVTARTGAEDALVAALNDAVDCRVTVVGGSSSRNHIGASTIPATQICSEGSRVAGCVTTHGACFAVCSPSVEVTSALFTCYEPTDTVLTVTKATNGREVASIGHKPAFQALNDACHGILNEFTTRPERFNAETHTLPLFYPVARELRTSSGPVKKKATRQHHVVQPEHADKDFVLHVGVDVAIDDRLRVMAIAPERVRDAIGAGYTDALAHAGLDAADVIGVLSSIGLCYSKLCSNELKTAADATTRAFPHAAVLGAVSHGQQGVFVNAKDAIHANGMITSLLITNKKKPHRHQQQSLEPLALRRISTY